MSDKELNEVYEIIDDNNISVYEILCAMERSDFTKIFTKIMAERCKNIHVCQKGGGLIFYD